MSLFTDLFAWFTGANAPLISSPPPQVVDTSVAATPDTLSSTIDCYVEGLIKSITESPSEWQQSYVHSDLRDYWFIHQGSETVVSSYDGYGGARVYVCARKGGQSTSLSEDFLPSHHARLSTAVKLHLETPLEEAAARKLAEVAATTVQRKQEAMTHFARLGCPDGGGSQS